MTAPTPSQEADEGFHDPLLDLLVPRPRWARRGEGSWEARVGEVPGEDLAEDEPLLQVTTGTTQGDPDPDHDAIVATAVERVRSALARHGLPGAVRMSLEPAPEAAIEPAAEEVAESYRLAVGPDGVALVARDAAGLLHGTATLDQWLRLTIPTAAEADPGAAATFVYVPALEVVDRPAFRHRGVLLDLARDKVPTMATLRRTVRWLSALKVNQLQLYLEHAFAYAGHEVVWRDASPLTGAEVEELDALCRAHAIELVPNQNSFGHFHRWLTHPEYRHLAECPEGVWHPWAHPTTGGPDGDQEPFSLCATDPRSLQLLEDLYGQLLPHFSSRQVNTGLDEAFDLGQGCSRQACEERGRHQVYLDFVNAVHELAAAHGRTIQFWADVLLEEPSLAGQVPPGATALLWGHEAGFPFAEKAAILAGAGVPFYVCPGTSAWSSLGGRLDVALANLAEAANQGQEGGAVGYLVTDWGDFGHLHPMAVSLAGLLAGAAAAWNPRRPVEMGQVAEMVDRHAFGLGPDDAGRGPGRELAELGTVYRPAGTENVNGSVLFRLLLRPARPLDAKGFQGLSRSGLEVIQDVLATVAARTGEVGGGEDGSPPEGDAGPWSVERASDEVRWVTAALQLACRVGLARLDARDETGDEAAPLAVLPAARRRELATELETLLEWRRRLWLERNRPGGLDHALGWLEPLAEHLADD